MARSERTCGKRSNGEGNKYFRDLPWSQQGSGAAFRFDLGELAKVLGVEENTECDFETCSNCMGFGTVRRTPQLGPEYFFDNLWEDKYWEDNPCEGNAYIAPICETHGCTEGIQFDNPWGYHF